MGKFYFCFPLSIIPKSLNNNHFAFEVTMRNGKKHATLRSLAVIANDSDIKLEVSVCPVNMLNSSVLNTRSTSSISAIDEVFENQWYRPITGWGTNPSNDHGNDLRQWSTRDCSYSAKVKFSYLLTSGKSHHYISQNNSTTLFCYKIRNLPIYELLIKILYNLL